MIELIEKKYLTPPDNEAIPVLKCFFCEIFSVRVGIDFTCGAL